MADVPALVLTQVEDLSIHRFRGVADQNTTWIDSGKIDGEGPPTSQP